MSVKSGGKGTSVRIFVPLRGSVDGKNLRNFTPNPGIFCLWDGYSAVQPAALVHRNELCKMKMK